MVVIGHGKGGCSLLPSFLGDLSSPTFFLYKPRPFSLIKSRYNVQGLLRESGQGYVGIGEIRDVRMDGVSI